MWAGARPALLRSENRAVSAHCGRPGSEERGVFRRTTRTTRTTSLIAAAVGLASSGALARPAPRALDLDGDGDSDLPFHRPGDQSYGAPALGALPGGAWGAAAPATPE
jgi:hypothetical protein